MQLMKNLSGIEIAEGIGWEVAEATCPVDVLQHTFSIVSRLNADILTVLCVPETRQRLNGDITIDQGLLYLEAHDDMQVISDFIRLDSNKARLHSVQSTSKGSDIHMSELLRENFLYNGILALPVWL